MFIGVEDEVQGFKLGGLKNVKTVSSDNAQETLHALSEFKGLIFLTEDAEALLGADANILESPEQIVHRIARTPGGEYENIDRIVRDTIGFDLKKKRDG